MNPSQLCRRRMTCFVTICLAAFAMVVCFSSSALCQSDPIPKEIRELKMGDTSTGVIEKISRAGSYSKSEGNEDRLKLTWVPPENPNFKDLTFQFTEKDRLYLIRFSLKEAEKDQIQALKRSFFDTQHFVWDDPLKLKVYDNSILLYIKESGPDAFLDFSNSKTGERSFELFNRAISVEDRSIKAKEGQAESQKGNEVPGEAKEPQAESPQSSRPENAPASVEKPVSEKNDAQPKKENQ